MAARLTAVVVALIVGVTLVAGLIVGAQRDDDSGPIDLLIYNGRVYTGDGQSPFAEALAVRGNKIYRVGSNREIKRLRRRATTVIDAHGGSVLPGFSDAHARLPLVDHAPAPPPSPAGSPDAGGAGGPAQPSPSADAAAERADIVHHTIEGAHRLGLTGLNTVVEDDAELKAYQELRREDRLELRVVAAVRVDAPLDEPALAQLDAVRKSQADDPFFRVDAVALRVDLPAEPAARPRRRGAHQKPVKPAAAVLPDTIGRALEALDRRGWNVVLQVDDEREFAAALDGLARLASDAPTGRDRRHRIELARPMPLDTARLKALGVAVSLPLPAAWSPDRALPITMSPASETTDGDGTPGGTGTASPDAPAGLRLLMASESLIDPRLGLQALVTGLEPAAPAPPEAPMPEGALAAAIDAYTSTAAWASCDEKRRGTLARDMLADIVILSADLFTLSAEKLLDAVVTTTIFDGKVVYDRETDAPHTTDQ